MVWCGVLFGKAVPTPANHLASMRGLLCSTSTPRNDSKLSALALTHGNNHQMTPPITYSTTQPPNDSTNNLLNHTTPTPNQQNRTTPPATPQQTHMPPPFTPGGEAPPHVGLPGWSPPAHQERLAAARAALPQWRRCSRMWCGRESLRTDGTGLAAH